jgi:nucleotide-binding universal stress UspA family protein
MLGTILFATDASSRNDAVIACAHRLAIRNGSKVVVVFVGAASSVSRRVHRQITQLREDGVPVRLAVVADGRDMPSVIAHMATAWSADLVMVGGGGTGVDLDLIRRVVGGSSCPVLAVPGQPASVSPPVPAGASQFRERS